MVGLGEGVAPSAATDMVARVIVKVCLLRMLVGFRAEEQHTHALQAHRQS